jgi:hypothetical protein
MVMTSEAKRGLRELYPMPNRQRVLIRVSDAFLVETAPVAILRQPR